MKRLLCLAAAALIAATVGPDRAAAFDVSVQSAGDTLANEIRAASLVAAIKDDTEAEPATPIDILCCRSMSDRFSALDASASAQRLKGPHRQRVLHQVRQHAFQFCAARQRPISTAGGSKGTPKRVSQGNPSPPVIRTRRLMPLSH